MKTLFPFLLLGFLTLSSCADVEIQQKLVDAQRELVQTEQELFRVIDANNLLKEESTTLLMFYQEIVTNIVHSKDDKYTIRIDQTKEGQLRYASWKLPKTPSNTPDVILYGGELKKSGSWGIQKYIFKENDITCIVETVLTKRGSKLNHIFLGILELKNQKFYGKMNDLNSPKRL